ncbi:MAG: NAD-dependent epimerase/dehydratase family protein [Patescibacteria group bacterium]
MEKNTCKRPKKLLILGSSSYVAQDFLKKISQHDIIRVERNGSVIDSGIIQTNNFDREFFEVLLRRHKPEKIINFIGLNRPTASCKNPFSQLFDVNCAIPYELLGSIRNIPTYNPRVFLIGSAAEYGVSQTLKQCSFSEESPTNPTSEYGLTKKIQTDLALFFFRNFGINVNVLRFSNIIGPGMQSGFLFSDIMKQINAGETKIKVGDLSSVRDFIYVGDATEALKKIIRLKISGEIINISSGKGIVIEKIPRQIEKIMKGKISFYQHKDNHFSKNFSILDNSKLKSLTGFQPDSNIAEIIKKIFREEMRK